MRVSIKDTAPFFTSVESYNDFLLTRIKETELTIFSKLLRICNFDLIDSIIKTKRQMIGNDLDEMPFNLNKNFTEYNKNGRFDAARARK